MPVQCALKLADVGHLSTTQEVHKKWTSRLEAEFFAQGDEERKRGMNVSPLMDRHNQTGVSKSQVSAPDPQWAFISGASEAVNQCIRSCLSQCFQPCDALPFLMCCTYLSISRPGFWEQ